MTSPAPGATAKAPGADWNQILIAFLLPLGIHRMLMRNYVLGIVQLMSVGLYGFGVVWCWADGLALLRRKLSRPKPTGLVRSVEVVCPDCKEASPQFIDLGRDECELKCGKLLCGTRFTAEFALVAGAAGNATEFTTEHDGDYSTTTVSGKDLALRVVGPDGAQRQITVPLHGNASVIFSPGDAVLLIGVGKRLRLVQNVTTRSCAVVRVGWCYIASFLYGEGSPEVVALRSWRDEVLLRSGALALLVDIYYVVSPVLIRHAGGSEWFRCLAHCTVDPIARRCIAWQRGAARHGAQSS